MTNERFNIIADAVYEACKKSGFTCRFHRYTDEFCVDFGKSEEFSSVTIRDNSCNPSAHTIWTSIPASNELNVRTVPLEEALEFMTGKFLEKGVELAV